MAISTILRSFFFFALLAHPCSSPSPQTFLRSGNATINASAFVLTEQFDCFSPVKSDLTMVYGRVFFQDPIMFLDASTYSPLSFYTKFTFRISKPMRGCPPGEGLAFVITSQLNSPAQSMGLPSKVHQFFAVEFDTYFDAREGDLQDSHVGVDVNSIISISSIELMRFGIDINSGETVTAWVEYRSSQKVVMVWVSRNLRKPHTPLVVAPVDLSTTCKHLYYVGFTAANHRGSSLHLIDNWLFKTVSIDSFESVDRQTCNICFPQDPSVEEFENLIQTTKVVWKEFKKLPYLLYKTIFGFFPDMWNFFIKVMFDSGKTKLSKVGNTIYEMSLTFIRRRRQQQPPRPQQTVEAQPGGQPQ